MMRQQDQSAVVGDEIGTRSLSKQINNGLRRRYKAAHRATQALAERPRDNIDLPASACQRRRAAAGFAEMAGGLAVIDHDNSAVLLGQGANGGTGNPANGTRRGESQRSKEHRHL